METDKKQLAEKLAKQIGKLVNNKILCPFDKGCMLIEQTLSTVGDFEEILFCPHCEDEIEIIVKIREY